MGDDQELTAQELFEAASDAEENGNLREAIDGFKAAIDKDPNYQLAYEHWRKALVKLDDPRPEFAQFRAKVEADLDTAFGRDEIGEILIELGDYDGAIVEFQRALRHDSDYKWAHHNWGVALAAKNQHAKAVRKFRIAVDRDPTRELVYQKWHKSLVRLDDPMPEFEEFRKRISANLDTAFGRVELANAYLELGLNDEAIVEFQKSLEHQPGYKWANYGLGRTLSRKKDHSAAIERFKAAIKEDPKFEAAYQFWHTSVLELDEQEAEFATYRAKVEANLDAPLAAVMVGNLLLDLNRFDEAIDQYKQAISHDPNFFWAYSSWGAALEQQQKHAEAVEKYQKAIELDSSVSALHFRAGFALLSCFRYQDGMEQFIESARLNPNDPYSVHNRASALTSLGQYGEARRFWNEALTVYERGIRDARIDADSWHFRAHGAIHHQTLGNFSRAEEIYLEGLRLDPDQRDLMISLAKLSLDIKADTLGADEGLRKERDRANFQAWTYFRKSVDALKARLDKTEDRDARMMLADLYLAFDDADQAKDHLMKLYELDQYQLDVNESLGVLYLNKKNYPQAIRHLHRVVELDPGNINGRAKLGLAYLKHGKLEKAEEEYRAALALAPTNLDALTGSGDVFKEMADAAETAGKGPEAEDYYSQAAENFEQVLSLHTTDDASKKLSKTELAAVNYSLGYTRVKLSEAQNHRDARLLSRARECFDAVFFGTPNYYKAERAKQRIDDRADRTRAAATPEAMIVVFLAVVAFLLGQLAFFVGKPVFGRSYYSVDEIALTAMLVEQEFDTSVVESLSRTDFFSIEHGLERLTLETQGRIDEESLRPLFRGSGGLEFKDLEPIGATTYGLLTFGGILFLVAGLYLREVSKLKFGAIEMEKTASGAATVSTSLGITS